MTKIKVAVLMGGRSSEREVSLMSGREVYGNLDRGKYEVWAVDVPSELDKAKGCEVAFIALHGVGGEDGAIQGYLETVGIKYTGCGVLASAIGMNKKLFRELMEKNNILMASLTDRAPCMVKPNNGGSSVGVSLVKNDEQLRSAIELAKKYDEEIVIEEYVEGIEVTCGVWGQEEVEAMPVVEIRPKHAFFDYESKYSESGAEEICPANLGEEMTKRVQGLAVEVFRIIGGRGFGRVDMIMRDGQIYVLEINTIPGLTPNSLLPKEARAAGYSYAQMLDKIIGMTRS